MKFCKDCKHFDYDILVASKSSILKCVHLDAPLSSPDYPVLGPSSIKWGYASAMRIGPNCGPNGILWEPKDANQ